VRSGYYKGEEVRCISKKSVLLFPIIILILFGFLIHVQQAGGGGTVTVVGTRIDSYTPSTKITVNKGEYFKLEVWFTNTGDSGAYFYAGATIWDSSGNVVKDLWGDKTYVGAGSQGYASWTISINAAGEYWLQFGIWDETKTKLLAKAPSPSQNLIEVVETTISAQIVSYSPSSQMTVEKGKSFTIQVQFKNTGNVGAYFYAGASIWDSNWNLIFDDWSEKIYLNTGESKSVSWTHTINTVGEYYLQFGVWDETKSKLFDKKPSPAEKLIKVIETTITQPELKKTFSVTIAPGGSAEDTIIIYNPNNVEITVKSFTITDYGGFNNYGSVTCLTSLPFNIPANSNGEIRVRITANSDCPSQTFTIKYKITGDPNNWEVLGD
jgi:hypothetical protein